MNYSLYNFPSKTPNFTENIRTAIIKFNLRLKRFQVKVKLGNIKEMTF